MTINGSSLIRANNEDETIDEITTFFVIKNVYLLLLIIYRSKYYQFIIIL